jgi:hypothetical protein
MKVKVTAETMIRSNSCDKTTAQEAAVASFPESIILTGFFIFQTGFTGFAGFSAAKPSFLSCKSCKSCLN